MTKTLKSACHGMPDGFIAKVLAEFSLPIHGTTFNFAITRNGTNDATVTHVESGMAAASLQVYTVRAPKGGWAAAGRAALEARIAKVGEPRVCGVLAAHMPKVVAA